MNQDIGRAIVFSIPVVSAAVSLIMILLDITRSSNTVNRKIHYSILTVYCLIMLYWSGLVMHSIARDAFIAYLPVFFSSFSFIPIFLYLITYIITGTGERKRFPAYHFILPSCLTVTIYVVAFIVPFRQRWTAIYDSDTSLTTAIIDITFVVCIVLSVLYSGLSLLRIKSYKRQVTDYSADIYRMSLDWLSFIILFRVVLQTLPIAGLILGIELFNKVGGIWAFTTLPAVFTHIVLCLNILSENYVIIEPITAKEKEMTASGNYAQLGRQRVEEYLENKKPYLNPEFKITDMAKDLISNRTYISAFINREYGMNFNRFVNNYRLKEVERLQSEAVQRKQKISSLDIVIHAGFSNYRSYFRAKKMVKNDAIPIE
ncbi:MULTISPECIES: AraC family transcriptional regulator [Butyricimonas]|uniref:AraC family transcriptional regulator n=1 Tax=Butyricimonas TaxID=574697 RepID=UPI001D092260|nr:MULTISPECIES: AraC family transcriptional regulator [Butyricimonas]MCB6973198.1 AraC family transcriptional regulator [Butyricimonas synergistica]MCG4519884.1 AraC family transcriptional regulator [Butyricimonas sp. DFI.6.44]